MPNAADVITTKQAGRTFRASRRTAAHIEWTIAQLAVDHPSARLVIIQTCYNTGVAASAGTHDLDAVLDVQIVGLDWFDAQAWLRAHGWAAWVRYPPTFGWHIHMVSLGYPGPVGIYVPGQVADYRAHRSGLAGHAADDTWHPADIDSTIFDYPAWLAAKEDDMPFTEEQLRAIVREESAKTAKAAIDASLNDIDEARVENPTAKGPKAMSLGTLLWATYKAAKARK